MDFLNFDNPWLWSLIGFCSFWLWILVIKGLLKLNFNKKYIDTRPDDEKTIEEETSDDEEEGLTGVAGLLLSIVGIAMVLAIGVIVLNQLKDTTEVSSVGYNITNGSFTSLAQLGESFPNFMGIGIVVMLAYMVLGFFYNNRSDEEVANHRKKVEYYEDGEEDIEDDNEEDGDETSFFEGEE